jgi:hypothetical protein
MRARLVTACTWILVTPAMSTGCRLDPVSEPPPPEIIPDAATPGPRPDANVGDRPASLDTAPGVTGIEAGSTGPDASQDGIRDAASALYDAGSDRPAPADLMPDRSPPDTAPDAPDPLVQGLVGHWRFDEGSGTRSSDSTGNGNNATLFNGTSWERSSTPNPGASDFAIHLDGNNDYASCNVGMSIPRIQDSKTITFWLAPNLDAPANPDSNQRTCVALANPGAQVGIQIGLDRNRPAAWSWGQDQGFVIASSTPSPGSHHVAYTFDGTTHRLYLDGNQVDTSNVDPQQGRADVLYIGTYEPPNELCAGQLDELRIYDHALAPPDITRLARRQ